MQTHSTTKSSREREAWQASELARQSHTVTHRPNHQIKIGRPAAESAKCAHTPTYTHRQPAMRTGRYLFLQTDIQRGRGRERGLHAGKRDARAKRPSHRPPELMHASEPSQPFSHPSAAGLSVNKVIGMRFVLPTNGLATEMTTAGTQKRDPPVLTDGSISRRSPPQLRHRHPRRPLRCRHSYRRSHRHHRRHLLTTHTQRERRHVIHPSIHPCVCPYSIVSSLSSSCCCCCCWYTCPSKTYGATAPNATRAS